MITIRIEGPRGSGKTTTAIAIARLLRDLKQEVKIQCHRCTKESVDNYVKEPMSKQFRHFTLKHKFLIVDLHEPQE